ncbi:MAG: stage V sporulation protein SpoVM [Clostridia bacterium]|nr:stage V sporulation protein SpoVM [Clostridia bacterium]
MFVLKIVVIKSPKIIGGILRAIFKIKKDNT